MNSLQEFTELLTGTFDNKEQYEMMQEKGTEYPFCKHVNTNINNKITNLPEDFNGIFMLEESYYKTGDKTNASPHLFLFTMEGDDVKLTSYDKPEGYNNENFTADKIAEIDYTALNESTKFTPAIYKKSGDVWEGGSTSMFSPVLKFTLNEKFSKDVLEVNETMEINGKRTFGYDDPILYKRVK